MGIKIITDCAESMKNILFGRNNVKKSDDLPPDIISDIRELLIDDIKSILETAELIHTSSTVALETIDEMLTFDKIDENKLVVELNDLQPLNFVNEVMKPFQLNAKNAEVVLSSKCVESESDWVQQYFLKADKFKLNQVLRNFLSNALKFTPPSGAVNIITEIVDGQNSDTQSSSDKVIRISVKDTGFGISKENQLKLFGQYVQFNANSLQQGKGSGLGLWISKSTNTIT
jgi:signal transduction histidine kinase